MEEKKNNIDSEIEKIFINQVMAERKLEEDLAIFEENQKLNAKYLKIVYDSYVKEGFSDGNAMYLTGIFYQSMFKK